MPQRTGNAIQRKITRICFLPFLWLLFSFPSPAWPPLPCCLLPTPLTVQWVLSEADLLWSLSERKKSHCITYIQVQGLLNHERVSIRVSIPYSVPNSFLSPSWLTHAGLLQGSRSVRLIFALGNNPNTWPCCPTPWISLVWTSDFFSYKIGAIWHEQKSQQREADQSQSSVSAPGRGILEGNGFSFTLVQTL